MKVTISEIKKLVPEIVHTAQMAVNQAEGSATMEHLNVLAHEIATKVVCLFQILTKMRLFTEYRERSRVCCQYCHKC